MSQGPICKCLRCEDEIRSAYPGNFVRCKCGESFVDWNGYYIRCGGAISVLEDTLSKDLEEK